MFYIARWKQIAALVICILGIYFSIPSLLALGDMASKYFPASKVNLGLDLRGGVSILLEADIGQYQKDLLKQQFSKVKQQLKSAGKQITDIRFEESENKIKVVLHKDGPSYFQQKLLEQLEGIIDDKLKASLHDGVIQISSAHGTLAAMENKVLEQSIEIIRRRIDEKGTREIEIQRQGKNHILLQVPGVEDPDQLKRLLGKTAKLTFHLVDPEVQRQSMKNGILPLGFKMLTFESKKAAAKSYLVVESYAVMSGDMLLDAQVNVNQGKPAVSFKLNSIGSKIFADISTKHSGRLLAIVLDNEVISAPVMQEPILSGAGVISGNFSIESANELALLLRAGALVTPLKIVEERVVGPNLGSDSITAGVNAVIAGAVLVVVFMVMFYGLFGVIADIALLVNLFLIIALLAILEATLTLPGLAGIALTLGMAVDANVLICERIREELKLGKKISSAIANGYQIAFATILDANITTVIAAVMLYIFGNGPIKGFSVTLIIGILSSMFTAVLLTKIMVAGWYKFFKTRYLNLT